MPGNNQRPIGYEEVRIVPYFDTWPMLFGEEKQKLLQGMGNHFIAIEHIGSTAVPGLDAKPIIDMIGGVRSMEEADAIVPELQEMGYLYPQEYNASLHDRRFLMKMNDDQTERTHHLHLIIFEGDDWKRRIAFRDVLRNSKELAATYAKLKRELAVKYRSDREGYTEAKTEFIERVLKQ